MIYLLRLDKGGYHPASSGTLVNASGDARRLTIKDFQIEIVDHGKALAPGPPIHAAGVSG